MLRNFSSLNQLVARRLLVAVFCVVVACIGVVFYHVSPVSAQGLEGAVDQTNAVAQSAGIGGGGDLFTIIGRIINVVFSLLGVIVLGLFIWAGFLYMTAQDNASKVEQAKTIMKNAVIGLLIIVSAYAITQFLLNIFGGSGNGSGGTGHGSTLPGGGFSSSAGALGGTIESHYPQRNATNVARNTSIIIRFKKPIQLSSIIQDYDDNGTPADLSDDTVTEGLNDNSIRIYRTGEGTDKRLTSAYVRVRFTEDRKTFVFRPVDYLGSASEDVPYTVELPANGVMVEDGTPLFTGMSSNGYEWTFETGTFIDVTPPRVIGIFPRRGGVVDRNAIIQIFFNEPIDPTSVSGLVSSGFSNVGVYAGDLSDTSMVDGEFKLSSDLKTVEFIPSLPCGLNSCGEEMFCLPEGAPPMTVVAHAATLDGAGPAGAFLADGFDGVVDVASNSLDGNDDGATQGRGADDYSWSFGLTNNINLSTPKVEETVPPAQEASSGRENVDVFLPISVRFDSILQASTFNSDNAVVIAQESDEYNDTFWRNTGVTPLTADNLEATLSTDVVTKSLGYIQHRQFVTSTLYDPILYSGIRNAYQNCFNPASSDACTGQPHCCLDTPSATECDFLP